MHWLPGCPEEVTARQSDRTTLLNGSIRPIWRFACEDEVRGSVIVANGVVLAPSYDHNLYADRWRGGRVSVEVRR